jgi:hypothetical protein
MRMVLVNSCESVAETKFFHLLEDSFFLNLVSGISQKIN